MTHDDYKNLKYFNNLDGLRGISIFLVILHHVSPFESSLLRQLQLNGNKGVWLFFIISGYLISTLLLRENDKKGKINLKNFLIRRGLRLYPLYYSMLLLYFLLLNIPMLVQKFNFQNKQQLFAEKFFSYLFYYSNFNSHDEVLAPFYFSWSLSAEEQFYLIFSVFLYFFRPKLICRLLPVLIFFKISFFYLPIDLSSFSKSMLLPLDLGILFGVSLGFLLHYQKGWRLISGVLKNRVIFITCLCSSVSLLCLHPMAYPQEPFFILLIFFMTVIFGHLLLSSKSMFFENRFVRYVGRISYGIYMYNLLVTRIVQKVLVKLNINSSGLELLCVCFITVAISHFSFKYFESYFNKMKLNFAA